MYEITLKLIDWKSIAKLLKENKEEFIGKKLYDATIEMCKIDKRVKKPDIITDMYDVCLTFSDTDIKILLDTMEQVDRTYLKSNDVTLLLLHGEITWQVVEQDRIREQFGYSGISEIEEDCKDD